MVVNSASSRTGGYALGSRPATLTADGAGWQTSGYSEPMSFTGSSLLGVWSRIPNLTAADFETEAIKLIEGRAVGSTLLPTSAVMAVGASFVAILRGVNPVMGLALSPHKDDLVFPLSEVRGISIGGFQTATLHKLPTVSGITWHDGSGAIEIIDSSGRSATFKPRLYDDSYWNLVGHLVDGMVWQTRFFSADEPPIEEDDLTDEVEMWEATVQGALRYFPVHADLDEVRTLECIMVGKDNTWAGLAVLSKKYFGFFEYDECLVANPTEGNPVICRLKDLITCTVVKPDDFALEAGGHILLNSLPQPNLVMILEFKHQRSVRLGISLESYTTEEKTYMERLVGRFLKRIEGKLAKRAAA